MTGIQNTTIADELRNGHPVATYTTGISMEPLLKEKKTYVVIEPLRRELQTGDLPIFRRPDGVYIIHRVIGQEGQCYLTRGDNCLHYEKVPKEQFLGIVTEIQRNGKTIRVTDRGYRNYVRFWNGIWPVRKQLYRIRGLKYKCTRMIRRML